MCVTQQDIWSFNYFILDPKPDEGHRRVITIVRANARTTLRKIV